MADQKYTFEDWKAGQIENDYTNKKIDGFNDQNLMGIGFLPEELNKQGFISDKEYFKIEKAQKETFDKAVEHACKTFVNVLKDRLENAYKPVELIKNRIDILQSEIDNATYATKDQVYAGEWSKVGIGYKSYKIANNPDELGIAYLHNTIQTPAFNTKSVNYVFVKTVSLRQIDELESLLESKYSDSKNNSQSNLGTHQENKDWVVQTFENVRPDFDSDNKAVKEVKSFYRKEFGLKIGDNTIRRYVGLID